MQTWAEVQTQIASCKGPFTVFLDNSLSENNLVVPGDSGITDCRGFVTFQTSISGNSNATLQVLPGAVLLDPLAFDHVTLLLDSADGVGSLDFSYSFNNGSTLYLTSSSMILVGTFSSVIVPDGKGLTVWGVNEEPGAFSYIGAGPATPLFILGLSTVLSLELAGYWVLTSEFVGSADASALADVGYSPTFRSGDAAGNTFPLCPGFTGELRYIGRGSVLVGGDLQFGQSYAANLNEIVIVNPNDTNITVTLPFVSMNGAIVVVKCDSTMLTSIVTVSAISGTIDGLGSCIMDVANASRTFMSSGGNWIITSSYL